MIARIPRGFLPGRRRFGCKWRRHGKTTSGRSSHRRKIDFLRLHVAPLLRFAADVDVAAETFTHKVERLKLQILQAAPSAAAAPIDCGGREPASPTSLSVSHARPAPRSALSPTSRPATPAQLTQVIRDLAPQMRNRRDRPSAFLKIDLPDFIAAHGYISVGEGGQQIHIEEYRRRVDARVLEIVETHPALAALREGREVTDDQLVDLERTLHRELGRDDIQLSGRNIRLAYGLRVGSTSSPSSGTCSPSMPSRITSSWYSAASSGTSRPTTTTREQIRFLRSVQEVFLAKRDAGRRLTSTILR